MQLLIGILAILAPYRARCDISSADGTLSIKLITTQSGFWYDPSLSVGIGGIYVNI